MELPQLLDEKKFSEYKWIQMNELVVPFYYEYEKIGIKIEEVKRIEECGMFLKFSVFDTPNGIVKKLINANFCRDKFCQICNWRRSLKYQAMYLKVLDELFKVKKYKVLFLTLTIKDPVIDDLPNILKKLNYGFNKLTKNKKFKKVVKGYIKSFECHFKNDKKYVHPHYHLLLLVNPSYFSKSKDDYIKHIEWREMWQKALNVDYLPQVSISSISRKNLEVGELKSILGEVLKYPFKSNFNLRGVKIEDFAKFRRFLKGIRLVSSGGIVKKKYAELFLKKTKIEDEKNENLIFVGNEEVNGVKIGEVVYSWREPGWHFLKE